MKKKYIALIVILCVAGAVTLGIFGGLAFINRMKNERTKANQLLFFLIPSPYTIEVESDGNWYVGYVIGSYTAWPFSGSNNHTYHGSGYNAFVNGYLTSGSYLTLKIRLHGSITYQKTITSTYQAIECEDNIPLYIILFLTY